MIKELICIGCPLGCNVIININDNTGEIERMEGNQCKEGKGYLEQEAKFPQRVLTATVLTERSRDRLLPVRTAKPIPREKVRECMNELAGIKVRPPIKIGEAIIKNIKGTGIDLIATRSLTA